MRTEIGKTKTLKQEINNMRKEPFQGVIKKLHNPLGSNELNAIANAYHRKFYSEKIYPAHLSEPIDLWYKKPMYGRLDYEDDVVEISETNLKQVRTVDGTIFLIDFVADALASMRQYQEMASRQKRISQVGAYDIIDPKTGWISLNQKYHLWMTTLYENFAKNYLNFGGKGKKIKNFEHFICMFLNFYQNKFSVVVPISKTAFASTSLVPPSISGLVADIQQNATTRHGEDFQKKETYLKDNNFLFFADSCARHGFMVDKNAPWRIIADIDSPPMKGYIDTNGEKVEGYMEKYGITKESFFSSYYHKTYQFDISLLNYYLIEFYNTYVGANPMSEKIVVPANPWEDLFIEQFERKKMTVEKASKDFGEMFWIKTYLSIRIKEVSAPWKQKKLNNVLTKAYDFLKVVDFERAIRYINDEVKGVQRRKKVFSDLPHPMQSHKRPFYSV